MSHKAELQYTQGFKRIVEINALSTNTLITKDGVFVFTHQKLTDGMPVYLKVSYELIGAEIKEI
jgi:hypothetical protein